MQPNGCRIWWTGVHAGLIKEKDCAEVANGPFGLTVLDSPGRHCCDLFFGEWWKKWAFYLNKVTSNWEVKRSLWITMNYLANLFFQTVKDYTRCKKRKTSKNLPRKHGWWREFFFHVFFYHISFPYFYHGCCCFCFFPFLGHRLESCLLFGPRAIWSERGIWNPLFEANFRFISVHIIDLFFKVADFSPKNMFGNKKKPPQILLPIHGSKDCWVETRVWRGKNFFGAKSTSHKKGHLHFIDACNEWVWFKKVSSQVGQKSSTWKSTKNSGACRMIGWSIDQAFSRSYQWAKLWLKMENSWQFLQKKTRFFTKKASSHTNHTFSWRSGVWRCFFWVWFFRDPGSPSENGFMEPRYYAFRKVIRHHNHQLRMADS